MYHNLSITGSVWFDNINRPSNCSQEHGWILNQAKITFLQFLPATLKNPPSRSVIKSLVHNLIEYWKPTNTEHFGL